MALRAEEAVTVAVTGAEADVVVDGQAAAWGEPVSVPAGAVLRVGPARRGVRSYVAVSGGIDVPEVLGSRSTDRLSGLGPPPVADGHVLPVGPGRRPRPVDAPRLAARRRAASRAARTARGLGRAAAYAGWPRAPGPSPPTPTGSRSGWPASRWTVRADDELPSEGLVLGAVQVPPDGQPLVFLADHPTTGGYPVVGVVALDDLWQCAQLRPGEPVGFRHVAG